MGPEFAEGISDSGDIGFVFAVGAIFVFDLDHDDGAPILDGQGGELLGYLLFEDTDTLHEVGILFAQADIFLFQEPPGQPTHLPLCTDIGSGAHNDVHTVFLGQATEFGHIAVAGKVELTFAGLMEVPEDIDAEGVHTQRLTHLDAVLPVRTGDAGVVHFGCLHHEGLAIEQEGIAAYGEVTGMHHQWNNE